MLKRNSKIFCAFLPIVIVCIALFSRSTGTGIKARDGLYLGYSYTEKQSEWLFLEYQNVPVVKDVPYVINENDIHYALYINGDGIVPSEVLKKEGTNKIEVLVDNDAGTQFTVPLRKF
jgi:hypothetical protein